MTHYAVLAAHYSVSRHLAREEELLSWGIRPIWYPPGQFPRIAEILRDLVEQAGTTKLSDPTPRAPRRVPPSDESRLRSVDLPDVDPHPETRPIVDALLRGEVAFFLGAYAHLGRLPLGDAFYDKLADEFDSPSLAGGRSAVATFAARRKGPRILWKEARKLVARSEVEPSSVYQVVTAMPSFLRSREQKSPLWIFTTNYDTVLERGLEGAGEPFHLLYYMEETGLFAHTSPDGSVREIERPDAIRDLRPPGTVVVKLNGGIVDGAHPTESAVIASAQFERLGDRIPHALPACVRAALRERSLLFLGQGLNEPDVHQLIAVFAACHERGPWAVQLPPESSELRKIWEERREYLNGLGLTTIVSDLEDFVAGLQAALLDA